MQGPWTESGLIKADANIKAGEGYLKTITIAWKGVAVGDFVTLVNATSGNSPDLAVFVFATANGTITKEWAGDGKHFSTGIRFNKGATGGEVYAEAQFR